MKQRSPSMVRTDSLNALHKRKALHLADNMSVQQVLIVSSHCVLRHNSKLNLPLFPSNTRCAKFYIWLTVHLGTILVNNQLDALSLMYLFIYFTSLHVSNSTVFIIRRSIVLTHHLVRISLGR